jgi:hypothetical protein
MSEYDVGKILIGFKRLGTRPRTPQGHMVLSGLQHTGKKSVTSSEENRDSQGLSRCMGDSRRPSNTQGFASAPIPLSTAYTLHRSEYSHQGTKKIVKISVLINTTTTAMN